jgi:DNA sulfur modification protein DndD
MATIIKSVSFQNFYNYYGSFDKNSYRFKEGINIVNADNNMGKSKFYNGILWILKDIVYDSDLKRPVRAASSFLRMASGKAINEENKFEMGVNITFAENENKYSVSKIVQFKKEGSGWKTNEKLDILQTRDNRDIPVLDTADKDKIIKKIIPAELMNYALLQGESMEELVDLSSHTGLSSTIEALAGIKNLIEIFELSKFLSKNANDLLKKKNTEFTTNNDKVDAFIKEQEMLEGRIETTTKQIEAYRTELSEAKKTKERLEALQLYAAKRGEYREKLNNLNSEINSLETIKNEKEKRITTMLFSENSPWILMGLQEHISLFDERRINLSSEIATQKAISNPFTKLPVNSPDSISLKRMIDTYFCEVCGRDAPEDSDAWQYMKKIYDRPNENNNKNHFSSFYSGIQNTVGSFSLSIPKIAENIQKYRDEIDELEESITKKKEVKDLAIQEFFNIGGNEGGSDIADRKNKSDYDLAIKTIDEKNEDIRKAEKSIKAWNIRLKQIEEELKDINTNSEIEIYRIFKETMVSVEYIILNSKERIFDEILKSLEINANRKYGELTQGNLSAGGKLNFSKQADGTVQVSIKNINDGELTGLGTGFQRMKQLSIIMAIISSKIGNKQFDYPFISDAPFSEFGDNFINNFFNTAPNVFNQSLILIKEFIKPKEERKHKGDLVNELGLRILRKMEEGIIDGTFYVNNIDDVVDRNELITTIKCYKE